MSEVKLVVVNATAAAADSAVGLVIAGATGDDDVSAEEPGEASLLHAATMRIATKNDPSRITLPIMNSRLRAGLAKDVRGASGPVGSVSRLIGLLRTWSRTLPFGWLG